MKVLHVTTGLALGGAENVLYRLIAHSGAPTNHTVVSMLDEGVFGPRLQSLGADVQCLNMKRGGIPSPAQIARLVSIIRRAKPAVVQTWMIHADFLGGIAGRLSG